MDAAKAEIFLHVSENLDPVGIWALREELGWALLLLEEELVTGSLLATGAVTGRKCTWDE